MTKTLILHVGMDKTGTSTVQAFLHAHRRTFERERGLLYPRTGLWSDRSHHPFAFAAFSQGGYGPEDLARLMAEFRAEVAASAAPKVILSSECLFKLPFRVPDSPFLSEIGRGFDAVRVVVYVRRQDLWVESRHRHSIISGKELTIEQLARPHFCDYKRFIDLWAERFGPEAITVRPFEPKRFAGGSVEADFCEAIGVDAGGLPRAETKNTTFHYRDVLFLRALLEKGLSREELDRLNGFLAARPHPGDPDRNLISAPEARALLARYAPVNAAIGAAWRGGAPLFADLALPQKTLETPDRSPDIEGTLDWLATRDAGLAATMRARLRGVPGAAPAAGGRSLRARIGAWLRPAEREPAPVSAPAASGSAPLAAPAVIGPRGRAGVPGTACLVHFGTHKTGSSSIQTTLFEADAGRPLAGYVNDGVWNPSLMLRNAFMSVEGMRARMAPGASAARAHVAKQLAQRRFAAAMARGARDSDRLILSAEAISHLDAADLAALAAAIAKRAGQVSWIGYVREPVGYLRSAFQEKIKTQVTPEFDFAPGRGLRSNYHRIVERLDALAGRERVQAVPFERELFPEGDVVRHFLGAAGIDPASLTIRRVNESMPMLGVKALYTYRRLRVAHDLTLGDAGSRPAFTAHLTRLGRAGFVLHPEIEARILADNAHILAWSEARMGRRLAVPERQDEAGVREEADMMRFDAQEIDTFALWAAERGLPLPAAPGPEAIAEALHALRMRIIAREIA